LLDPSLNTNTVIANLLFSLFTPEGACAGFRVSSSRTCGRS
jgi:hypothetical protein